MKNVNKQLHILPGVLTDSFDGLTTFSNDEFVELFENRNLKILFKNCKQIALAKTSCTCKEINQFHGFFIHI